MDGATRRRSWLLGSASLTCGLLSILLLFGITLILKYFSRTPGLAGIFVVLIIVALGLAMVILSLIGMVAYAAATLSWPPLLAFLLAFCGAVSSAIPLFVPVALAYGTQSDQAQLNVLLAYLPDRIAGDRPHPVDWGRLAHIFSPPMVMLAILFLVGLLMSLFAESMEAARRRAAARSSPAAVVSAAPPPVVAVPPAVPAEPPPVPEQFPPQPHIVAPDSYPRLTVGNLLGQTFSIYFSNILAFMLVAAIVLTPALIPTAHLLAKQVVNEQVSFWLAILPSLLFLLMMPAVTAALTYGVFQQLRGKPASSGSSVVAGLSRLLSVVGAAIWTGLALAVGYAMCIVPGIVASVVLYLTTPVAVVEKVGVSASMRRSAELTRGHRWQIFELVFCLGIIQLMLSLLANRFPYIVSLLCSRDPAASQDFGLVAAGIAIYLFVQIAGAALQATAAALTYFHLRTAKESVDSHELAAVFD